jgi:Tol biopolymer transport system component
VTVTAPPRPLRPNDPVGRDEPEALIEEARQRARRRRRIYSAIAVLVALSGITVFTVLERSAQSQTASPALSARSSVPPRAADSKIAFIRGPGNRPPPWAYYLMNADGSGQRNLTREWGLDGFPGWSPDGEKILFGSERDGNWEIYLMNADGSGLRRLTRHPATENSAAWSPDGRKIAFIRSRRHALFDGDIYVMNADGSGQRRLTSEAARESGLAWSPDGQKIAFGGWPRAGGNGEIYVMNADGSGRRNLTRSPGHDFAPAWSPDGRKILFTRSRDMTIYAPWENVEIYVMNADGSDQRNLTRNPAFDSYPAWSPDGRKIAFVSYRDRDHHPAAIYVVKADGSGLRRLASNLAKDPFWSWSPDGQKIAFASRRDGNPEIYAMNADGSELRRLTRDPAWDTAPAWVRGQKK